MALSFPYFHPKKTIVFLCRLWKPKLWFLLGFVNFFLLRSNWFANSQLFSSLELFRLIGWGSRYVTSETSVAAKLPWTWLAKMTLVSALLHARLFLAFLGWLKVQEKTQKVTMGYFSLRCCELVMLAYEHSFKPTQEGILSLRLDSKDWFQLKATERICVWSF